MRILANTPSGSKTRRLLHANTPPRSKTRPVLQANTPSGTKTRRLLQANTPSRSKTRPVLQANTPSRSKTRRLLQANTPSGPKTRPVLQANTPSGTKTRRLLHVNTPSRSKTRPVLQANTPSGTKKDCLRYPPLPAGYPSAKHKAAERMGDRSPQSVRRPFLYRLRTERTGPALELAILYLIVNSVSLRISDTVGCGKMTRCSSAIVMPCVMAIAAPKIISLHGLPSMCTPSTVRLSGS